MKLAIYNHGIPFDGDAAFTQPLGGSETSIIHMARELVDCGHNVTVYANLPSASGKGRGEAAGEVGDGGPAYKHYHEFFTDHASRSWDALIAFRSFDPFLLGRVAPRTIYWTGDAFDQPALKHFGHRSLQENIDLIFCVSKWHRRTFIDTFDLPSEKVIATRNGFSPGLIPEAAERQLTRAAYSSTPFRGLDVLLKVFPDIRSRISDASLDVFSSMRVYGWTSDEDSRAFGTLYEAAAQPGVTWHGSVAQPVLLEHLSRTGLFLYPNTFDETSCMAAIEAQAAGCVVITSARAGLNETVEHGRTGICLKGDPRANARERAFQKYTWSSIAAEWTAILEAMPARPGHARLSGPLTLLQKSHDYLRNGNVSAASRVLTALDRTPFLRNEVEELKGKLSTWM
jgi:glycosyltransferase involved in cell wall biosynthesis